MIVRRKKSIVGLVSAICGLVVVTAALITGVAVVARDNTSNRTKIENMYKAGFYDLKTGVDNMEMNLSKLLVSREGSESAMLASDAYLSSQTAVSGLSVLPLDYEVYHKTSKLINQVGDLCNCYSRDLGHGADISAYEDNIEKLYKATARLKAAVEGISDGWTDDYRIINGRLDDFGPLNLQSDTKENTFEYPEVIYDGPFSDTEGKKCFKGLDELKEITACQALQEVRRLFSDYGISREQIAGESYEPDCYIISGQIRGKDVYITLSKRGGKVLSYDTAFAVRVARMGKQAAQQKAEEYAAQLGYAGLKPVWYNSYEGVAYVNLAPEVDGVIYYTDLVKVKVGLDNGKLIGVEALGFCTNHCARTAVFNVSENTALNAISKKITVNNIRKALIPINGGEKFCYEIAGSYNGLDYFVYIDAITGKQINIMRVVNNYQGEMVI